MRWQPSNEDLSMLSIVDGNEIDWRLGHWEKADSSIEVTESGIVISVISPINWKLNGRTVVTDLANSKWCNDEHFSKVSNSKCVLNGSIVILRSLQHPAKAELSIELIEGGIEISVSDEQR